jgi:hypothetical protein
VRAQAAANLRATWSAPHDGWFDGFDAGLHRVGDVEIFARTGGTRGKPALLLLHGFPQTHAIWHRVARQLPTTTSWCCPTCAATAIRPSRPARRPRQLQQARRGRRPGGA